jgi:hypothetical protein
MKKKAGKMVTEEWIVEAAVQLFVCNGFRGTSTRDISRMARVNEVLTYRPELAWSMDNSVPAHADFLLGSVEP